MGEMNSAIDAGAASNEEVLSRIGHMTRALHENLRGLGLDKLIEKAASDIPDARDRLDYVARLSEQAAKKVLDATDSAGPLQDAIETRANELSSGWQALLDKGATEAEWRELAQRTVASMNESRAGAVATRTELMNIMMAQDFQDITGQLIKKVVKITQAVEGELAQLLRDNAPPDLKEKLAQKQAVPEPLMQGPSVPQAALNQDNVDDLLADLGF